MAQKAIREQSIYIPEDYKAAWFCPEHSFKLPTSCGHPCCHGAQCVCILATQGQLPHISIAFLSSVSSTQGGSPVCTLCILPFKCIKANHIRHYKGQNALCPYLLPSPFSVPSFPCLSLALHSMGSSSS